MMHQTTHSITMAVAVTRRNLGPPSAVLSRSITMLFEYTYAASLARCMPTCVNVPMAAGPAYFSTRRNVECDSESQNRSRNRIMIAGRAKVNEYVRKPHDPRRAVWDRSDDVV
jgi:hypothetical protein